MQLTCTIDTEPKESQDMGNGMCKSAPIAPFRTVGIALQMEATKTMRMASVAERPAATTELAPAQVETVTRSENQ